MIIVKHNNLKNVCGLLYYVYRSVDRECSQGLVGLQGKIQCEWVELMLSALFKGPSEISGWVAERSATHQLWSIGVVGALYGCIECVQLCI
jgi:hypothetical protein